MNTQGSYKCVCPKNLKLDPTNRTCIGDSNGTKVPVPNSQNVFNVKDFYGGSSNSGDTNKNENKGSTSNGNPRKDHGENLNVPYNGIQDKSSNGNHSGNPIRNQTRDSNGHRGGNQNSKVPSGENSVGNRARNESLDGHRSKNPAVCKVRKELFEDFNPECIGLNMFSFHVTSA